MDTTLPQETKASGQGEHPQTAAVTGQRIIDCTLAHSQVAIPVVPTVSVVVTFTKFVELPSAEQFYTPLSSPCRLSDGRGKGGQEDGRKSDKSFLAADVVLFNSRIIFFVRVVLA